MQYNYNKRFIDGHLQAHDYTVDVVLFARNKTKRNKKQQNSLFLFSLSNFLFFVCVCRCCCRRCCCFFAVFSYKFLLAIRHLWSFVVVIVVAVAFSVVSCPDSSAPVRRLCTQKWIMYDLYTHQARLNENLKKKKTERERERHEKTWNPMNLSVPRI